MPTSDCQPVIFLDTSFRFVKGKLAKLFANSGDWLDTAFCGIWSGHCLLVTLFRVYRLQWGKIFFFSINFFLFQIMLHHKYTFWYKFSYWMTNKLLTIFFLFQMLPHIYIHFDINLVPNGKQCRCRSVGFFRSLLIWIYTVCEGRAYHCSAGQGLTHFSQEPHKRITCKQCRPISDAAECGIWSGSTLFTSYIGIFIKHTCSYITTNQTPC